MTANAWSIPLLAILIVGCTSKQKKETAIGRTHGLTNVNKIIIAHTTEEFLERGVPVCFLNEKGDTIIPFGKYRFGSNDTIKHVGFVLHEGTKKGWMAIDNEGRELFRPFIFDNGPDYIEEGLFRIENEKGQIGFADTLGNIVIEPQFAFAFPFKNGKAKVTFTGRNKEVPSSKGEYHHWESDDWYHLTPKGEMTAINPPPNAPQTEAGQERKRIPSPEEFSKAGGIQGHHPVSLVHIAGIIPAMRT